ncbi:tRNA pseudouridine synthase-like 1 isoform X3 [Balaenoptera ricei]|uniref:tRNA pseudouridine synthase-like 1 isoform X3 n=1 Tax=Balaenoptera ricei TaxID=2746895 RepID=UPI0028BD896E|nr:tRNA pseudouridine synthase-like 1 isoform X3 [Balaenoptera ricei]
MGAGSVRARYLVYFQYLGTGFNGVAAVRGAQHAIGVQNYLEEAAERLNSVVPVKFTISSRTDAGVHALSNAAHLDVQRRSGLPPFSPEVLLEALNTHLRHPAIRVLQAFRVPSHFHARHAAASRTYLYRLVTGCRRPDQLPVFERNRCWALRADCLDVAAMREAAQHLLGTHDFRAFQSAGSPATSPVRTLRRASVSPDPAGSPFVLPEESRRLRFWSLEFESQSFLYRQVRRMTSVLVAVGLGALMPAQVKVILESQDPLGRYQSRVAPAHGLFLKAVLYEGFESTARRSQVTPDTQQGQGSRGTLGPAAGRSQLCTPPCITHGPRQAPRLLSAWTCHKSPPARVGCQRWGAGDKRKHRKARHPNSLWWFFTGNQHPGSPPPHLLGAQEQK